MGCKVPTAAWNAEDQLMTLMWVAGKTSCVEKAVYKAVNTPGGPEAYFTDQETISCPFTPSKQVF